MKRLLACALSASPCAAQAPALVEVPGPPGYPLPAHSRHGMVASSSSIASAAGVERLKRGGARPASPNMYGLLRGEANSVPASALYPQ